MAGVWMPLGRGWRGCPLGLEVPQEQRGPHQLLRGWHPQKEMFFIWKKWLQRSNWKRRAKVWALGWWQSGHPAPHPCPPLTSSSRLYSVTVRMSLMPCSVISRSQLAGGRRCTVSFLVVAIWGHGGCEGGAGVGKGAGRVCPHCHPLPQAHLLHGGAEDAVALVVWHLHRAQELHVEPLHPARVPLQACAGQRTRRRHREHPPSPPRHHRHPAGDPTGSYQWRPWLGRRPRGRRRRGRCPSPLSACCSPGTSSHPPPAPPVWGHPHPAPAHPRGGG